MSTEMPPQQAHNRPKLKSRTTAIACVTVLLVAVTVVRVQSQVNEVQTQSSKPQVITIRLGPDQIGVVKTGEKLSTRLSFREPIKEVICGDLYDPSSGTGSFVIQRIDNDVFIKPVAPKGKSNMFVKTGEKGEYTYNFSLEIVPPDQAYLIVKVINTSESANSAKTANTRRAYIAPPLTNRVAMYDVVPTNVIASAADGLLLRLRGDMEMREPPPPPSAPPKSSPLRQREPVKRVAPEYPEGARTTGVVGEVLVEVGINKKGKVKSARVISGPLALRNAAILAARMWRFTPIEDEDVDEDERSYYTIKFNFNNRTDANIYTPGSNVFSGRGRRP
jgi:TonB family protein